MSKTLKTFAGIVIALFAVAMIGLVALAGRAVGADQFPDGGLERAIAAAEEENLNVTAASPYDIYGEEFVAGVPVCPGTDSQQLMQLTGLPEKPEGLPEEISENENYLVLVREDGSSVADGFDRASLDLCAVGVMPPFSSAAILPFAKTEEGNWVLAG
ncbi:hypothetical protein C3B44_02195 [Corynebacterium yudongzhengii]|uniref:Uncharacterized protein n=1 Tax=Corynebacterium yudongzhengii TaxID=2080740 RepID=A0A2U1T6X5_9CORY|nr:hypothetical protein [Corynebacterium yudongzhengii]AWB81303.1 hypothetical protein C3B44_02195 [Corynebacterium yudongzhengii]PWC01746.1 hypothetical protein DF222_05280 [Corynebacterium yudongzhengii]